MSGLIEGLQGVSAGALLGWIVAIVTAMGVVSVYLEKYRRLMNQIDEYREKIAVYEKRLSSLEDEVKAMKTQYDEAHKEFRENFVLISDKLDGVLNSIAGILEYNKTRDRADLKDRIRSLYSNYHNRGRITKNEKESLMDLISTYEISGGDNSFVHSLILPEISTWTEID